MTNANSIVKEEIKCEEAVNANDFGSNAIQLSNFVFLSNQLPIDPLTNSVSSNIEVQTNQVIQNIVGLLSEKELQLSDVVKLTIYVTDFDLLDRIKKVYNNYFEKPYPAITVVEVNRLQYNANVSFEAIAIDTNDFRGLSRGKCSGCNGCSKCGK